MHLREWIFGLLVIASTGVIGCASRPGQASPQPGDGAYDSEFPSAPATQELTRIAETVRMINVIASYRRNEFPLQAHVRTVDVRTAPVLQFSERVVTLNRRASGSALVIQADHRRLALLSCAHVVRFADTIYTFHAGSDKRPTEYVRTMSVKQDQEIYVRGISGGRRLEILAIDDSLDLVLLGKRYDEDLPPSIVSLPYPAGKAEDLGWGTFVYVFGYPAGYRMLTRAIVSSPNRDKDGSFLLDASAKPGYSGGAVFAIRDGIPNFELVGLVKSSKGPIEFTVSPTHEGESFEGDLTVPYQGDLYVELRSDLDHGVAEAIPAEMVTQFLRVHHDRLRAQGYEIVWGEPAR